MKIKKTRYLNHIFKDGVSLPGLVLKYLIKSTDSEFYLFDEADKITKEDRKRNNLFYCWWAIYYI